MIVSQFNPANISTVCFPKRHFILFSHSLDLPGDRFPKNSQLKFLVHFVFSTSDLHVQSTAISFVSPRGQFSKVLINLGDVIMEFCTEICRANFSLFQIEEPFYMTQHVIILLYFVVYTEQKIVLDMMKFIEVDELCI